MSYFTVEIFTPGRVLDSKIAADELLIPTVRGQINVLPEHTHLITKLDTGVLTAKVGAKEERNFFISTGICKVLDKKVTILAEVAEEDHEIDHARATTAHEKAHAKLNDVDPLTDHDLEKYRRKLSRALVRTELAKGAKK